MMVSIINTFYDKGEKSMQSFLQWKIFLKSYLLMDKMFLKTTKIKIKCFKNHFADIMKKRMQGCSM